MGIRCRDQANTCNACAGAFQFSPWHLVSQYFHRTALMVFFTHVRIMAILQQLLAVHAAHSTCVGRTIRVDGRVKVQLHHVTQTAVRINSERIGRRVVVHFISIRKMVVGIHNLTHPDIHFFILIVVRVQELNLNDVLDVITYNMLPLRRFLDGY